MKGCSSVCLRPSPMTACPFPYLFILLILWLLSLRNRSLLSLLSCKVSLLNSCPFPSPLVSEFHSLRLSSQNSIPFASRLRIPFPSPISPRKAYSWSLISVESQDYWFFLLLFLFSRSFTFLFYHSVIKETEPQPFSFCSCELFFLSQ